MVLLIVEQGSTLAMLVLIFQIVILLTTLLLGQAVISIHVEAMKLEIAFSLEEMKILFFKIVGHHLTILIVSLMLQVHILQ